MALEHARLAVERLEARTLLASSNTLTSTDFEVSSAWSGATVSNTGGASCTKTWGGFGTIDVQGSTTPSQALKLNTTIPATGTWTSTLDSGKLAVTNTITNLGLLSLRFSLKATQPKPIQLYLNSYASSTATSPSGALQITIYPAVASTYQHYEIDLSTMTKSGTGTFNATAPYVSVAFQMSSQNGWGGSSGALYVDNFDYAKPTYYVRPGGNNGNDGLTESTAFRTPAQALSKAKSGDIIELMTDSVGSTYTVGADGTNAIAFKVAGTPSQWITMKNYPGQTPQISSEYWSAINIGDGNPNRRSTIAAPAYIDVRGLTLEGDDTYANTTYASDLNNPSAPTTNGDGIDVSGGYMDNKPHDIVITDNVVEHFPGAGIAVQEGDRVEISSNITRDNCWWTVNATSGISILSAYNFDGTTGTYTRLILQNSSYSNETYDMYQDGTNPPRYSDGNGIIADINHNTKYDTGTTQNRTLIQNNISFNNGGAGVQVTGADHVDVINNTAYHNSHSPHLLYGEIEAYSAHDVNVVNNIMVAPDDPTEPINGSQLSDVRFAYNLYAGGNNSPIMGTGDRIGNPNFVDPSNGYFKLNAGSDAIGHGIVTLAASGIFGRISAPGTDLADVLRSDTSEDIGAYAYTV